MKKHLLLLTSLLFCFTLFSQNNWEEITLPGSETGANALGISDNGLLILGTAVKVYYSNNDGDSWTESSNWSGSNSPKCIAFNSSEDVFIGTYSNGIFRSTDGGNNFTEINNGLGFLNVWCVIVLENDDILVGTPGGIYKSTDNGDNWSGFGIGLPDDDIETLIMAENGKLYAGTFESGVYCSTDDGQNWTECNNGLPTGAMVTAMSEGPTGSIFAGIYPEGMYRSVDQGDLWEPFNDGLPFTKNLSAGGDASVVSLWLLGPFLYAILYYYGCFMHFPLGMDLDEAWTEWNEGLPYEPETTCMTAGGPNNLIFIGTFDQGVYRNTVPVGFEEIENMGSKMSIYNYPNPFNEMTTFNIYVPETKEYTLTVNNKLGQKVTTVFKKRLEQGNHRVSWSCDDLESGVYFYSFTSANTNIFGKLIIR